MINILMKALVLCTIIATSLVSSQPVSIVLTNDGLPDYGIARPSHMTINEWRRALQLFDNEWRHRDSSSSLLHARINATLSWTGVACRTKDNNGLQCVMDTADTSSQTTSDTITAAATRDCVFLHGSGERADGPVTNTFPGYWGSIEKYTSQCLTRTFIHANTLTRSWYDYTIMRQWCDVATGTAGGQVITNKLIFTHSMGGLILGAAIYEGVCSIDLATTSWYQAGSPQLGSRAADMAINVCADPSGFAAPIRWVATYMGYCVSTTPGPANEAYLSMVTTDANITAGNHIGVIAANIKGAMCGISGSGLVASTSIPMAALAALTCNESCDGMVGITSCAPLGVSWGTTPQSNYYRPDVNHPDETCRNGNGWSGDTRQPCSWFTNRV